MANFEGFDRIATQRAQTIINRHAMYSTPAPIHKSQENDLEKGGEGSKGGKVIGHTESGKPIYDSHDHSSHKNFTPADHIDAFQVHHNLREKERQKIISKHGSDKKKIVDELSSNETIKHHNDQKQKHLDSYGEDKAGAKIK